jgi:hypothetical protein
MLYSLSFSRKKQQTSARRAAIGARIRTKIAKLLDGDPPSPPPRDVGDAIAARFERDDRATAALLDELQQRRVRAGANEIDAEKKLTYRDSLLSSSYAPPEMSWKKMDQTQKRESGMSSLKPDWGKFTAGVFFIGAGLFIMVLGGVVIATAIAEHASGAVAAPETFGLSELLAIAHSPAVFAEGILVFGMGATLTYLGGKLVYESGVPGWLWGKLTGKHS